MSRIDEALKRAAATTSERDDAAVEHPPPEPAEPFALERYQREPSIEGDDRPAGAGEPSRSVARAQRPRLVALPGGSAPRAANNASGAALEQYRRIETVLQEAQATHGVRTVMVTSAQPGEGRTQAALQLAVTLSRSHARVLLVDADLRQPGVHEALGIRNEPGVAEWLQSELLELPLVEISPQLRVLLAGFPSGSPLSGLVSDEMRVLLAECAARFDWVVLDGPPIDSLPEPQWLSNLAQAAVLVIGGDTPFPVVQDAISRFGRARIIATVLNGTAERRASESR